MSKPKLQFWYDFASTYSYLSAMRIEASASAAGVTVDWRPFLLGPIFKAQGWTTSPFNFYPAKGRYMIRDIKRLSHERGLVFHMPSEFPVNGIKAARLALVGKFEGWIAAFTTAIFRAQFETAADISEDTVLETVADELGLDFARLSALIAKPDIKERLRAQTAHAGRIGIFGAPVFVTPDDELFWGDDRLDQALKWVRAL